MLQIAISSNPISPLKMPNPPDSRSRSVHSEANALYFPEDQQCTASDAQRRFMQGWVEARFEEDFIPLPLKDFGRHRGQIPRFHQKTVTVIEHGFAAEMRDGFYYCYDFIFGPGGTRNTFETRTLYILAEDLYSGNRSPALRQIKSAAQALLARRDAHSGILFNRGASFELGRWWVRLLSTLGNELEAVALMDDQRVSGELAIFQCLIQAEDEEE